MKLPLLSTLLFFLTYALPNLVLAQTTDTCTTLSINLLIDPACGDGNVTASVETMGGSGNFIYSWSNGETGATAANLNSGEYFLSITDLTDECFLVENFEVEISPAYIENWTKTYGGSDEDTFNHALETPEGDIIAVGISHSTDGDIGSVFSANLWDIIIGKFTANGELIWLKNYGGNGSDVGIEIIPAIDGGYLIGGTSNSSTNMVSSPNGGVDIWMIKIDEDGNLLWEKSFGGADNEEFKHVQAADDGYLIAGSLGTDNSFIDDAWFFKINLNGDIIWSSIFAGDLDDDGHDICPNGDGYFAVVESRSINGDFPFNSGYSDTWLLSLDSEGNMTNQKHYVGDAFDEPKKIMPTADGNFIMAIQSLSNSGDFIHSGNSSKIWLFKIDPAGETIWKKEYGRPMGNDIFKNIKETLNGEFHIVAYDTPNVWIYKTDAEGVKMEEYHLRKDWPTTLVTAFQQADGSFTGIGGSYQFNSKDSDKNYDCWLGNVAPGPVKGNLLGEDELEICEGTEFHFDFTGALYNGYEFLWHDGSTASERTFIAEQDIEISLTSIAPGGCPLLSKKFLRVDELSISAITLDEHCNATDGSIYIKPKSDFRNSHLIDILWENGESENDLNELSQGNYHVTINDGYCELDTFFSVAEANSPMPYIHRILSVDSSQLSTCSPIFGWENRLYSDSSIFALLKVCDSLFLHKFNLQFETVWEKYFPVNNIKHLYRKPNGGYLAVSAVQGGIWGIHLTELDEDCNVTNELTWNTPSFSHFSDLIFAPDGSIIISAYKDDVIILRINENMELISTHTYGGSDGEARPKLLLLPDGNLIVACGTESVDGDVVSNHGNVDTWIFKTNPAGEIIWSKSFGGSLWDNIADLLMLPSGQIAVAVNAHSNDGDLGPLPTATSSDIWLFAIDDTGELIWQNLVATDKSDRPISLSLTADGKVALYFENSDNSPVNNFLAQINQTGEIEWMTNLPQWAEYMFPASDTSFIVSGKESFNKEFLQKWEIYNSYPDYEFSILSDTSICFGDTLFISNQNTPYYEIIGADGSTDSTLFFNQPGAYELTAISTAGCNNSSSLIIDFCENEAPQILEYDALCDQTVVGIYVPGTDILWSNGDTTSLTTVTETGEVEVTVTFPNGTEETNSIWVDVHENDLVLSTIISTSCPPLVIGTVDLMVQTASDSLSFIWSNGVTTEDLDNLNPGDYFVLVLDEFGCQTILEVNILNTPPLTFEFDWTPPCPSSATGSIFASASGGTGDLSFLWSTGDTIQVIDQLPSGVYTVTVTDEGECSSSAAFPLTDAPIIESEFLLNNPTTGQSNGSITVEQLNGQPPLSIDWSTGDIGGEGLIIDGLPAGNYSATITDGNGCMDTVEVILENISTALEKSILENIQLSPNPTSGLLNLHFSPAVKMEGEIIIFDNAGKKVYSKKDILPALDLNHLPSGSYFLQLKINEQIVVRHFIKI